MWARSLIVFIFLSYIVLGYTQNDGRYRPPTTIRTTLSRSGNNDGRYRPSGNRYRGGSQDGRYVHKDVKYIHDDRPDDGYSDNISPYKNGNNYVPNTKYANNGANKNNGNNNYVNVYGNGSGSGSSNGNGNANRNGSGNSNGNGNSLNTNTGASANSNKIASSNYNNNNNKNKNNDNGGQYNKDKKPWSIIHLRDKVHKDGYEYLYETENGILAEENGSIQKLTTDDGLRSRGFYEYTGDDGIKYRVDYVADDNGFVPSGTHIPTPPPHVKKLLEFLETNAKKV